MVEVIKNKISNRLNIFRFLAWGAIISLVLYFSLFAHTVYNVVGRQTAVRAIGIAESNVEQLESAYFDLKGRVNAELATAKGFIGISSATYISRKTLGKVLTLNNEI